MEFLIPHKILLHFGIVPGMCVVELHAGNGHFTEHLKEMVGAYGIVHSLQHDDSQSFLSLSEPVDCILLINIPFAAHPHASFKKAYKALKPDGKMILVEKKGIESPEEYFTHLAGLAGFAREKHFHAGEHHFGLVFKKA